MFKRTLKITLKSLLALFTLLLLFVAGRYALAVYQVQKAEMTPEFHDAVNLGSTSSLNILPLFEKWARSNDFQSGHGVSYLIQTDQTTILMDLGNNEQNTDPAPLLHNMEQMDIAVDEIDIVVISHNHPDHVGGVSWWRQGAFAAGGRQENLAGKSVYLPVPLSYPALDAEVSHEPAVIAPGVATLGRQPFVQPFPFWLWEPLGWEQSLAVNVEGKGLVIVMGCGHPSMEKVIERAEALFDEPVVGILGGLHYLTAGEQELSPHIEFLALRNPELVALSPHDSSGDVLQAFEKAFPEAYRYLTVGWEIIFPSN